MATIVIATGFYRKDFMKAKNTKSKEPEQSTALRRKDALPPASPSPEPFERVLKWSAEDLALVRAWLPHNRDESIRVEIRGDLLCVRGMEPSELRRRIRQWEATGTTDPWVQQFLIRQAAATFEPLARDRPSTSVEEETLRDFAVAMLREMRPRNVTEAISAIVMIAACNLTACAAWQGVRVLHPENRKLYTDCVAKMGRTIALQLEALKKYRGDGQQKMLVKHVHVHQGGQAVVGQVEAHRPDQAPTSGGQA